VTIFEYDPSIKVIFGAEALSRLGEQTREFSSTSVLVVSDPGIVRAGIVDRARETLTSAGVHVRTFGEVCENPSSIDIDAGLVVARAGKAIDLIVAIGGGSAMDCAKGINFLLTNGGRIEDYQGFGKADKPMLPSIGIPTTAGTGSEAQSYALISHDKTHAKMACGDRKARFRSVILDPDLIGSAPRGVKASSGYDAVAHAAESYVCTTANPLSRVYAREAMRLLDASLEAFVLSDPDAKPGDVLLGAHFAGMAIEASMLGAAHACANPLTAEYGTTHGVAVGVMLPHVVDYNTREFPDLYEGLGEHDDLGLRLREIRSSLNLPERLRDLDVQRASIPGLARAAAQQWTGTFNPRPIDESDCEALYETAF
jgi:alcohol dehydrogenase